MKIESFKPNEDASGLILEISDAAAATSIKIWTDKTYKDYDVAIDLSSLLNGNPNQLIEISTDDLQEPYLNGAYFVEVEEPDSLKASITESSVKYEECILNELSKISLCDDCLQNESISLINAHSLLIGFRIAITKGFIEEARNIRKALDKFCSNDCKSCGKYNHIKNNRYYDYES